MRLRGRKAGRRFLLVLAGPEPACAVLVQRGNDVQIRRAWHAEDGTLPRWVRRASINHKTLLLRTDLNCLLEPLKPGESLADARVHMARLDLPGRLELALGYVGEQAVAMAMRAEDVQGAFDAADLSGLVVDGLATLPALAATQLGEPGCLCLALRDDVVILAHAGNGLALRRIHMGESPDPLRADDARPEDAGRISRALQALAPGSPPVTILGGPCPALDSALSAHTSPIDDRRHPDTRAARIECLQAAARALSNTLPVLTTTRQYRRTLLCRWSTPVAIAAAGLAAAAMLPLLSKVQGQERMQATTQLAATQDPPPLPPSNPPPPEEEPAAQEIPLAPPAELRLLRIEPELLPYAIVGFARGEAGTVVTLSDTRQQSYHLLTPGAPLPGTRFRLAAIETGPAFAVSAVDENGQQVRLGDKPVPTGRLLAIVQIGDQTLTCVEGEILVTPRAIEVCIDTISADPELAVISMPNGERWELAPLR